MAAKHMRVEGRCCPEKPDTVEKQCNRIKVIAAEILHWLLLAAGAWWVATRELVLAELLQ